MREEQLRKWKEVTPEECGRLMSMARPWADEYPEHFNILLRLIRVGTDHETRKRADRLQAELAEVKGKLAGMPRPVLVGDGKQGWTLEYKQIFEVYKLARNVEQISMEDVEAVMVAMVDAQLAYMTHEGGFSAAELTDLQGLDPHDQ